MGSAYYVCRRRRRSVPSVRETVSTTPTCDRSCSSGKQGYLVLASEGMGFSAFLNQKSHDLADTPGGPVFLSEIECPNVYTTKKTPTKVSASLILYLHLYNLQIIPRLSIFNPINFPTKLLELHLKMLIPSVNILRLLNDRLTFSCKSSKCQCRAGS